ncbi:MAG: GspH/FimT family pseudopilin [Pseudomonadota bacterium]
MNTQRGFTLVELLYSVGIAALVLGVGVPSFIDQVRSSRMNAATNTWLAALYVARSEAVKQRTRVTVCRSTIAEAPACSSEGTGYAVFVNADDDASFDSGAGDVLLRNDVWQRGGITTIADGLPIYVSYVSSGFTRAIGGGAMSGDVVFCDERGNAGARILRLPATGRPQIVTHGEVSGAPSCAT